MQVKTKWLLLTRNVVDVILAVVASVSLSSDSDVVSYVETILLPQNLLHCFTLCKLINQLVQIAYFLHQWIFDFFYAHTAHYALN